MGVIAAQRGSLGETAWLSIWFLWQPSLPLSPLASFGSAIVVIPEQAVLGPKKVANLALKDAEEISIKTPLGTHVVPSGSSFLQPEAIFFIYCIDDGIFEVYNDDEFLYRRVT